MLGLLDDFLLETLAATTLLGSDRPLERQTSRSPTTFFCFGGRTRKSYRPRQEPAGQGSTPTQGISPDTAPTPVGGENYETATAGAKPATVKDGPGVTWAQALTGFRWSGAITPQKWMNFYTKVSATYATSGGLELTLTCAVDPPAGVSEQRLQDTRRALRGLGLDDTVVRLDHEDDTE